MIKTQFLTESSSELQAVLGGFDFPDMRRPVNVRRIQSITACLATKQLYLYFLVWTFQC